MRFRVVAVIQAVALLVALLADGGIAAEPQANEPPPSAAPQELFAEAVRLFFAGEPVKSAELFDRVAAALPEAGPELWQRGIALYYAERFADGRRQFELHEKVNPNDVENPAWHFLCVARLEGVEAARRAMLPVGDDPRVPMKEILELFAGRGDEAAVLAAAEQGPEPGRRNQLCYAHLYLGLHAEACGDAAAARRHIIAAASRFRMDHYMGRVAVVHAQLRGWDVPKAAAAD
jgi:lipoprotein NlpI